MSKIKNKVSRVKPSSLENNRKKKVLVIDNYDSFTYNLVHYLEDLNCEVTVKRNDKLSLEEVEAFDKIVLSPGPGIPDEAGLLKQIIEAYAPTKSMLGVCLGQQAICEVFGGKIINLNEVHHGVSTKIDITVNNERLYKDMDKSIEVGRYHSWVCDKNLPEVLEATAFDGNGQIMSIRHRIFNVTGVQYHPESVLTPDGKKLLENWLLSDE